MLGLFCFIGKYQIQFTFKLPRVSKVLVKHGEKASVLYVEGEEAIWQLPISTGNVLDTNGAGDTFTAAFDVALVEGKSEQERLTFAAAAASLCIQVKGQCQACQKEKPYLMFFGLFQTLSGTGEAKTSIGQG